MFILDNEQTAEAPTLDQLLRAWWAKLRSRLRRHSPCELEPDDEAMEQDRSESLIL
jgi:hypothetical protein